MHSNEGKQLFMNLFALIGSSQQECIPVGCIPPACCPYLPACTAPGGVPGPRGVPGQGGVPGPGGYLVRRGVYLLWGGTCPGTSSTPPVDRQTRVKT